MSAVNLWKPHKLHLRTQFTELNCKWRFVRIAENRALNTGSAVNFRIWSTLVNIFSAPFSSLLHRTQGPESRANLLRIPQESRIVRTEVLWPPARFYRVAKNPIPVSKAFVILAQAIRNLKPKSKRRRRPEW
jgi:hypothetical protein